MVDAGGGGDDVDDGVDGAYLVEVDFFYGYVVDLGFGVAEEFERLDGELFHGSVERGPLDEGADFGERAAVGVVVFVRLVGVFVVVGMSVGMAGFVLVLCL